MIRTLEYQQFTITIEKNKCSNRYIFFLWRWVSNLTLKKNCFTVRNSSNCYTNYSDIGRNKFMPSPKDISMKWMWTTSFRTQFTDYILHNVNHYVTPTLRVQGKKSGGGRETGNKRNTRKKRNRTMLALFLHLRGFFIPKTNP